MIRTQLELFPEKIKKTKSIIIRKSSSNNFRGWNDVMIDIAKNFSIPDRQYFAGMIDGDGSFHIPTNNPRKLRIGLELRHDHAEPVLRLAELFDLTISKISRLNRENHRPSLKIELGGIKANLFLYAIQPYLLEKRNNAIEILKKLDCPFGYLSKEKQFSFEYLAGYTDAEGTVRFNLLHLKTKIGNITSSYRTGYVLTSNDNAHLQFIKQRLIEQGFDHFRKDYIDTYKRSKRKNRKPTTQIILGGSPAQLSKFYEKVEPFMLIKHKKDNMRHTILYDQITNRRVYREVE